MSADRVTLVLLWLTVPPVTGYAVLLAFTTRWWLSLSGWALFMFGLGFAMLVDLSLVYRLFGEDYDARDAARLLAFSVCCVGAWLKFITIVRDKIRDRRS